MRGPPTVGLCLVCLGLLALPALPAFAAPPDPQAIVRHIQQGRYLTARDALHRLLFSEEGPLWRRRAVYLLGHVHLKLGDFEQAAQYFDQARTVLPTLSDYALYNAGVAEAGAG
ncbi:MAG: tol-pal system YbgF family protein, partial [Candidatus Tectimicrobiota bacterium]